MTRVLHLCDTLADATVSAPTPQHVELQYLDVGGEQRFGLFQHPNSTVRFPLPAGFPGGRLTASYGIKTGAWSRIRGAVRFRIGVEANGGVEVLHEGVLDPKGRAEDRRWRDLDVAVPAGHALVFETLGVGRRTANTWSGWGEPLLAWDAAAPPPRRRTGPLVLLVTADALRADYLGCYGNEEIPTPNIDGLAAEGLLFLGARANASTTPGNYASLLTGMNPFHHGVLTEWGVLPAHLPNLATELARAGYHTAFIPGEHKLGSDEQGFPRVFAHTARMLANPCQPGAAATRKLFDLLAGRDGPSLIWVDYFDTHPPHRLPEDLVARFYAGDPRAVASTYQPEAVRAIRASETLAEVTDSLMVLMRRGVIDDGLLHRLRDTADTLAGDISSGPDLAVRLTALGPEDRLGLSVPAFASWLKDQVQRATADDASRDLIGWLDTILIRLRELEAAELGWLDGVVDYRFPLAQTKAAVAYLDQQIGDVVADLREREVYDDTTIVFCAPHGELYGEGDRHFHHLALNEPVLRIPMVVKPARSLDLAPGRVDGPFELIDLLPTLLDALGLPHPVTDGASRIEEIRAHRPVPDHDVFAVDMHALKVAIVRGADKLVKSLGSNVEAGQLSEAGTTRLYRLTAGGEVPAVDASLAQSLEQRLDRWLETVRSAGN